jgi:hypothetical protein
MAVELRSRSPSTVLGWTPASLRAGAMTLMRARVSYFSVGTLNWEVGSWPAEAHCGIWYIVRQREREHCV